MMLSGRPIQRSGTAPPAPETHKVELGRLLAGGVYVQAKGGPLEVSWSGADWFEVLPGPPLHFLVSSPYLYVRSPGSPADYVALGVLR